jgi:C-terminal processing protease CtpA/Prc
MQKLLKMLLKILHQFRHRSTFFGLIGICNSKSNEVGFATQARAAFWLTMVLFVSSCASNFNPQHQFSTEQIQSDYALMRKAITEGHPGVYRYTSPDSIRWIFDKVEKQLTKPMTEREFRRVVNPVFSYIRCGHTDIYQSTAMAKFYKNKKNKTKDLPLSTLFLENKIRIVANNSNDSTIRRGDEILAIDSIDIKQTVANMRDILPSDGYNQTFKNTLINGGFTRYYWFLNGDKERFNVTIKDSTGLIRTTVIAAKKPTAAKTTVKPTSPKPATPAAPKPPKENKRRNLKFSDRDSTVAILDINTFGDAGYKRFYRRSFKQIKQKGSQNLIIDLRANGGGKSDASINLMSYFLDSNYVVYDTVFSPVRKPFFNKYFSFPTRILRFLVRNAWSKKPATGGLISKSQGKVHKPNRKYRFDGPVYILTNGSSFSATSIFSSMVNEYSPKITMIGRETGGGRYGCNAMVSPYMILPYTKARVRMPMFKVVLHLPGRDTGRGVMPEYAVEHTFEDAIKNRDVDFEKAYELIKAKRNEH